jgi:hypothetical protein
MVSPLEVHKKLTPARVAAYERLFEKKAESFFPYHRFAKKETPCLIDVFVFRLDVEKEDKPVYVAVTNGMSDFRMYDNTHTKWCRRELLQYFRECKEAYARRLHDVAWVAHFDRLLLDSYSTVSWPDAVDEKGKFKHSLMLESIWQRHSEFSMEVDGDPTTMLWHIPIRDDEMEFKRKSGVDALLDEMGKSQLPWIFDEANRPRILSQ